MSQQNTSTRQDIVDTFSVDGDVAGVHSVRIDYTNGSAQILDQTGDCIAHYGPGVTRHTLDRYLRAGGWYLTPGGTWTTTDPPDGRQHPISYRVPEQPMTSPTDPLDLRYRPDEAYRGLREDAPDLVAQRFGPGPVVLGTIRSPRTGPHCHSAIHRIEPGAVPLMAACSGQNLNYVLAATDDPSAGHVIAVLDTAGYEACRMCRACWPGADIPQHDRFHCVEKYRLPANVERVLSAEAIATIAGILAPSDEVNSQGINTTPQVWDEIRAAFPVHKFHDWVQAHAGQEPPFYDPEQGW